MFVAVPTVVDVRNRPIAALTDGRPGPRSNHRHANPRPTAETTRTSPSPTNPERRMTVAFARLVMHPILRSRTHRAKSPYAPTRQDVRLSLTGRWPAFLHGRGVGSLGARHLAPGRDFRLRPSGPESLLTGDVDAYNRKQRGGQMAMEDTPIAKKTFAVLVVDGDPTTISGVREAFEGVAQVRQVPNGYQALYELSAHPVDVIVLELFLPGASGIELLQRMHSLGIRVPVVVLTHAGTTPCQLDALDIRQVLHKPASADALRAAITDALSARTELRPPHRAKRRHRPTTPSSSHQDSTTRP